MNYGLINPRSLGNRHSDVLTRLRKEVAMETKYAIRELDDQVRRSSRVIREVQDEALEKMIRLEELEQKLLNTVDTKLEDYRNHLDDMMMMIRECPQNVKKEETTEVVIS